MSDDDDDDDDDDAFSVLLVAVGWMGQMMRQSCLTDTGEEEGCCVFGFW
jgi:hypothetical protein